MPKLKLSCDWTDKLEINEYGGAVTQALGSTNAKLEVDGVTANVKIHIVPRKVQVIPSIVGHPFTE